MTPASIERYLAKEVPISMDERASIGTSPEQSAMLKPGVIEILSSGRPLTVAIKTELEKDAHFARGREHGRCRVNSCMALISAGGNARL